MSMHRPIALACATLTMLNGSAAAETIAGRASVVDADTIEIHGERTRILDIDAPETPWPRCEAEKVLGFAAADRPIEILNTRGWKVVRDPN